MLIESKFRKLFWIRIGIGVFIFLITLIFIINGLRNPTEATKQYLIVAFILLLFLVYVSTGLLETFSLKIMEDGFEKTSLIFRTKEFISFNSILSMERQKVKQNNMRGVNISDGFHFMVLQFENGKDLIISPDNFENYTQIIEAIKIRIE